MRKHAEEFDAIPGFVGSIVNPNLDGDPTRPEFLNRDLSWLEFNRRVLHEASDERTPLLERFMFLSIFTSNLDEFIMKRVAGLREQTHVGVKGRHPEEGTPEQILDAIGAKCRQMLAQQAEIFEHGRRQLLPQHGIHVLDWEELSDAEKETAGQVFRDEVYPVLTPLAVDSGHPFPFLSNLSTSLGVTLRYPKSDEITYARVKVPQVLPQWVKIETPEFAGMYRFVSLLDLIRQHLNVLFPEMVVDHVTTFRVTRNAEVDNNQHDNEDLLGVIEESLRQRRMEHVVRLEHSRDPDVTLLNLLMQELELRERDVYEMPALMDYTSLKPIIFLPIPGLHSEPFTPVTPKRLADEESNIFQVIRTGDMLVHHPYESFDATVRRFIEAAVEDPDVLAIKMTVYRTGTDSPFIPLLIRAAEAGKQVVAMVELKARFDEQENIHLAQMLEKAGVHVVYGMPGLKTHTKTTLVVRRESGGVMCYGHVGTGNYHTGTARLYDDLGLLTCRDEITKDLVELFNYLTGRSLKQRYQKLLVAPVTMKRQFIAMIEREVEHHRAERPARIVAKMNQLEDRKIIKALYDAGKAGVPIDLIVRGFCILRPQLAGLSDNIRIISVIGRFLEHSRIYYFRNAAEEEAGGEFYIGSADWMHRNLDARVEAITPVDEPSLRERLWSILNTYLLDHRSAWDMRSDGTYVQRRPTEGDTGPGAIGSHRTFMDRVREG
jgi:polyphosphate kinase